ncbi:hypothetical protein F2Q68_00004120 [Brassica cretica]|uniref:Uncharacterized protein n=1 Tax=Brassica cretica TaxID=69181 RepID=A0A8S9JEV2_BRACR|nr:hypothetical protein F2Q68_00004120 [Brassica cretica]
MCIEAMVISYHRLDRGSVFYSAVSRLHQSSFFSSSYHEITTFSALMSAAKDISRLGILLPEINYDKYCNMGSDGFVGYDSVEDQVFTLLGGPKKQQLRSLDIQGTWNLSLEATFTGNWFKRIFWKSRTSSKWISILAIIPVNSHDYSGTGGLEWLTGKWVLWLVSLNQPQKTELIIETDLKGNHILAGADGLCWDMGIFGLEGFAVAVALTVSTFDS